MTDGSGLPDLSHRCLAGGGNAVIRPYQCEPHWRAAGIPTGSYATGTAHHSGYRSLDDRVRVVIADAIRQIDRLLTTGRFESLAFSWDSERGLGCGIFDPDQEVRDLIVSELIAVADRHAVTLIRSTFDPSTRAGDFGRMIHEHPDMLFVFNDNEEEFYAHFRDPGNPYGVAAKS
jgi:hypothetical protein